MSKTPSGQSSGPASDPILSRYEPVIGLEVHCQLKTVSKLFCGCSTKFGALPNYHTCPVCLGMPGVLPVLNTQAVTYAIRLAMAVGAEVHEFSEFSRKQYFYPDLPKGYQITQFDKPYCTKGRLTLGSGTIVRITRIHMEEDAGKNVHGDSASYVDLNRAGIPLLEIVSEADIRTAVDAADYMKRLHALVQHLDICDGNLEEGSFRCDVNISLRPRGQEKYGTRCEIKNLNSFKNVERAIRYEIVRQADILDAGDQVKQATLNFDAASGRTSIMRLKEESHDYRYFPEPDLGHLKIPQERLASVKAALPELPEAMAKRFQDIHELPPYDAGVLTADRAVAEFFETVVKEVGGAVSAKIVANWVTTEFLRELNEREWTIATAPIRPSMLAELLQLLGKGTISGKIAKTIFEELVEQRGTSPAKIMEDKGLMQITDRAAIEKVISEILRRNPSQVAEFHSGKEKVFGYFVGEVMKISKGKMNPGIVNEVIRTQLAALKSEK